MLANYDILNTKYPRLSLLCEFFCSFVCFLGQICVSVKKRTGLCVCGCVERAEALRSCLPFSSTRLQLITGRKPPDARTPLGPSVASASAPGLLCIPRTTIIHIPSLIGSISYSRKRYEFYIPSVPR